MKAREMTISLNCLLILLFVGEGSNLMQHCTLVSIGAVNAIRKGLNPFILQAMVNAIRKGLNPFILQAMVAQSAGAVEYTGCNSA